MNTKLQAEHDELQRVAAKLVDDVVKRDDHLRQASDEVTRLQAKVRELEAELAPVRALKVGSWRWAMMQTLLGHDVRDFNGRRRAISYTVSDGEPYTLHVEPEPEPSVAELKALWERIDTPSQADSAYAVLEMRKAMARVKRKESGDGR